MSGPRPSGFPRLAGLSDLARILSGDRAHRGAPPGVTWTWFAFPEAWPLLTLDDGTFTGPGEPLGQPGDLWWFSMADLHDAQPGGMPGWLEFLAGRAAARFVGAVAAAFGWLGELPLVWTVPDRSRPVPLAFQPHFRLAFGGSLFVVEQWVCRLNITSSGTLMTDGEADTALPAIVTAASTFVADNGWFGTGVKLEYVKLNKINSAGHYENSSAARTSLLDPAIGGGGGGSTLPPQVAVCATLLTAHARGKAHKGRIYLPALAGALITYGVGAGTIGGGAAGALGDATHAFIQAINAALPSPNAVSVISSTGEANHVTGVAIGSVYDTQRRRRRSLPETPYLTSALDL